MVTSVTTENFEKEIANSDIPVLIDFWAGWCRPCQMMGPVFEELAPDYKGKVKFVKINVEENEELAAKFGITGIPAIVLANKGKEVDRFTGFAPKDMLKAKIDFMIGKI
jgi:thioredoxin 1